ncbi:MAG: asparagine synthase C-terminal domain-containing protein, partial [Deltaproteobacteria bacterium]|nr:asparagine synthase C-terminal domain-containing protein [Deltaproteobacteria bacterium]
GYTPNPCTFFKGIRKIPPGGYAVTGPRRPLQVEYYWNLETIPSVTALSFDDSVSTLRRKIAESVELQMVSEVPIGVFLSGGLDSSAVVALMRGITDGEIKTFSVGYGDFGSVSELPYARRVAKMFRTRHFEYDLKFGEFFESIRTMLTFTEEPIVESAAIALYHLSVQAKKEATVLLSGEGSDELFAGYPLHRWMRTLQFLARAAALLPGFLRNLPDLLPLTEKQRKYADWIRIPLERRYRTVSCDVTDSIRKKIYTRDYLKASGRSLDTFFERSAAERNGKSDLAYMLYLDTKYWLPDDLLLKADKMTMAASLELRVPFLDPEIVEFAACQPDGYKIRGGEGKYLLKKAMEGLLPDDIIYRSKQGFPLPLRQWFQGALYGPTRDILLSPRFLDRGIVRRDYVEEVLSSHRSGREDHSRRIFSFLALEIWMRTFRENPVVSE